ncbi:MAG: hypothetical protein N3C62_02875 [Synergistetes bacterium]|nr:hypothetical protein [Synergistota bacterium]MCX8127673.1 hypothetical protein [Synergistota bacterium]MDW8191412.1 hypothetical protein [Synergistota bacterium]
MRRFLVFVTLWMVFGIVSFAWAVGNPALNYAERVFAEERQPNPEVFSFIKKLGDDRKLDELEKIYINYLAQVDSKLQHKFFNLAMDGKITEAEIESLPDLHLLYEDFVDNRNGWPHVDTYERKIYVANNGLYIQMERQDLTALCIPAKVQPYINRYPDYIYTADVAVKESGYTAPWLIYGIMFRVKDLNNFYMFLHREDGVFSLQVLHNNKPRVIRDWTKGPLSFSTMKVVVKGDRISCYVLVPGEGERKIFDVRDSSIPSGGIGVIAMGSVKVKFTNLNVIVPKEEALK